MLAALLAEPGKAARVQGLLGRLCTTIASRRNAREFSSAIIRVAALKDRDLQRLCLAGFRAPFKSTTTNLLSRFVNSLNSHSAVRWCSPLTP